MRQKFVFDLVSVYYGKLQTSLSGCKCFSSGFFSNDSQSIDDVKSMRELEIGFFCVKS